MLPNGAARAQAAGTLRDQIKAWAAARPIEAFAIALGVDVGSAVHKGDEGYLRCSFHADHNPSFRVHTRKALGTCDVDGAGGDVFDVTARRLGLDVKRDFRRILAELASKFGIRDADHHQIANTAGVVRIEQAAAADRTRRITQASKIWQSTRPASGTPTEAYLRSRGIKIDVPPSIRHHADLYHASGYSFPAMVAGVQAMDGEFLGVHRTYLDDSDGDGLGKARVTPNKAMLGPLRGGTVRLAPISPRMGVAEGLETSLSVQQAAGLPMLAALSAAGIENLQLPAEVLEIVVCVDRDDDGVSERAARRLAARLHHEHRRIWIARPGEGRDFNDELMQGGGR